MHRQRGSRSAPGEPIRPQIQGLLEEPSGHSITVNLFAHLSERPVTTLEPGCYTVNSRNRCRGYYEITYTGFALLGNSWIHRELIEPQSSAIGGFVQIENSMALTWARQQWIPSRDV